MTTTFGDVLGGLETLDDDMTIYVRGGADADLAAEALVAVEPDDGGVPSEAAGMDYLLEVPLAKEAIDVWRAWRNGRDPTIDDRHDAVTYYAANDAFLPVA